MSLLWRVFAINAALVVAATLALAITPATVSADLLVREVVVLTSGLILVLALNFLLLRRTLDPLERLTRVMHRVDLLRPGARVPAVGGGREAEELASAFNEMLERLEGERRLSGRRAIEAQEHERRRIALELHDEVGQLLTGVVLALDGLHRSVDPATAERVAQLQEMVREGVEHVREIARGLRPESLDELGLRSALVGLAATTAHRSGLRIVKDLEGDLPRLSADVELVVYRVAQEALTNIARHARARRVVMTLSRSGDDLELRLEDDGRGIDPGAVREGRGLAGMLERALYVGGTLEVTPLLPRGTSVVLRVPVEAAR